MRGQDGRTGSMFSYVDVEERVPINHPLCKIREFVNAALAALNAEFAKFYSTDGLPSIAPERLSRAALIQILFSIRSERQLMEQMQYNLLFRWFVARHGAGGRSAARETCAHHQCRGRNGGCAAVARRGPGDHGQSGRTRASAHADDYRGRCRAEHDDGGDDAIGICLHGPCLWRNEAKGNQEGLTAKPFWREASLSVGNPSSPLSIGATSAKARNKAVHARPIEGSISALGLASC